jgi:hypothetical protein
VKEAKEEEEEQQQQGEEEEEPSCEEADAGRVRATGVRTVEAQRLYPSPALFPSPSLALSLPYNNFPSFHHPWRTRSVGTMGTTFMSLNLLQLHEFVR